MEYGTRVELTRFGRACWSFKGHGTVVDTNGRLPYIEVRWDGVDPGASGYNDRIPMMGMEIKEVTN